MHTDFKTGLHGMGVSTISAFFAENVKGPSSESGALPFFAYAKKVRVVEFSFFMSGVSF
jgi:hypothetical protein